MRKIKRIVPKGQPKIIRKNYDRIQPKQDWLKYWRVVRYWVTQAYGLTYPEIEMLLFLYSENLFSRADFEKYERIMVWNVNRFNKLVKEDWIVEWRKQTKEEYGLYTLSFRAKRIMCAIYKKLSMEEVISENPADNPLFRANLTYMQRRYRTMIVQMNKIIRENLKNKNV